MAMFIPRHHFPVETWPLLQTTTATSGMEKSSGTCRTALYVTANSLPYATTAMLRDPEQRLQVENLYEGFGDSWMGTWGSHQPQLWKWFGEGKAEGLGRLKMPHL